LAIRYFGALNDQAQLAMTGKTNAMAMLSVSDSTALLFNKFNPHSD
jgi:hypothetical protein